MKYTSAQIGSFCFTYKWSKWAFVLCTAVFIMTVLFDYSADAQTSILQCPPQSHEFPPCPRVDCNDNKQFVKRVKKYFNYTPPANNRDAYYNPRYHNYRDNIPAETQIKRPFGARVGTYNCELMGTFDNTYSEPCQDNRYRDMCLIGTTQPDLNYAIHERPVADFDLPWDGVRGAAPYYDALDTEHLNCMTPKNTERVTALELDNGWRFRHMCPGNKRLNRTGDDKITKSQNMFSRFNCWAPLPKCELESDWELEDVAWQNEEKGKYSNLTKNSQTLLGRILSATPIRQTLESVMSKLPGPVANALRRLFNTKKSRRPECKPAFWVRYMMDSCANQFILKTNMIPEATFNPDASKAGESAQYCQPFRTVNVAKPEYKPYDYMKMAVEGLLEEDYMPWIKPHYRFAGAWDKLGSAMVGFTHVDRKIKGMKLDTHEKISLQYDRVNPQPTLNSFANRNVETILDPSHPFSPRFDVAETIKGVQLTDRTVFTDDNPNQAPWKGWTETPSPIWIPKLNVCHIPLKKDRRGYFEYGECTVYCSAVNVDLLRFRYKDYVACMGCNIQANEKAFWDEVEVNRKHYKKQRCWAGDGCEEDTGYNYNKKFKNPTTDNEFKLCESCKKRVTKAATCTAKCATQCAAACAVTLGAGCATCVAQCAANTDSCKDAAFLGTVVCPLCGTMTRAEAMGRARTYKEEHLNELKMPPYGPSAMKKKEAALNGVLRNLTGGIGNALGGLNNTLGNLGSIAGGVTSHTVGGVLGGGNTANTIGNAAGNAVGNAVGNAANTVGGAVTSTIGSLTGNLLSLTRMWPVCSTRFDDKSNPLRVAKCAQAKLANGGCLKMISEFITDPNIGLQFQPAALAACTAKTTKQICNDVAKPVAGINFLKIRTRKEDVESADADWNLAAIVNDKTKDGDAAIGYDFRTYFGNNRPYMRWWDTGQEAFQTKADPDYSCDWGSNDTITGVGRDYNSIHGRKAKLCRFGGGGGVGGNCFEVEDWLEGVEVTPATSGPGQLVGRVTEVANQLSSLLGVGSSINFNGIQNALEGLSTNAVIRRYPALAGSEWAELKMYQANCHRYNGLNCLCQYEKIFKPMSSEEMILYAKGAEITVKNPKSKDQAAKPKSYQKERTLRYPLPWLGYASEPLYDNFDKETLLTSPAIPPNQQFPNLHFQAEPDTMLKGLDSAMPGDVVFWPAGTGTLPRVGIVVNASNAETISRDPNLSLSEKLELVPAGANWVKVMLHNDGKFPDACGNTEWLGYGATQTIYRTLEDFRNNRGLGDQYASDSSKLIEDQLVATYYCENSYLDECVDRNWSQVQIFRPSVAQVDPRLQ